MRSTALNFRFSPPNRPAPTNRGAGLDALRAIAAFLVMFNHLTADDRMPFLVRSFSAGRPGVLLFFIISGYVIGRTNQQPWQKTSRSDYWRRRMRRLAPLYFLAVAVSFAAACLLHTDITWSSLIGHLLCLQNFESYFGLWIKPIWNDQALWTLHYEMVFYALFLAIWRFAPLAWVLFAACFLPGFLAFKIPIGAYFILSCSLGFGFWLVGLVLAWQPHALEATAEKPDRFPFVSLLFLLIATHQAAPFQIVFTLLGLNPNLMPWVSVNDLALLPCCVALVGCAIGARFASGWIMRLLCLLPPVLVLCVAAATGHNLTDDRWAACVAYTLIGTLSLPVAVGTPTLVRWLAPWGGVSYAVYLFHLPIHYLAKALLGDAFFTIPVFTFALTLMTAHLLEQRLHPWFVNRFWPDPRAPKRAVAC